MTNVNSATNLQSLHCVHSSAAAYLVNTHIDDLIRYILLYVCRLKALQVVKV